MENQRRNNLSDMTVSEIIQKTKESMCDSYCKYEEESDKKKRKVNINNPDMTEPIMRELVGHCKECPLNRL